MASYIFNHVKGMIATGQLKFSTKNIFLKLALVNSDLSNYSTYCSHTVWGDKTNANSVASKEINIDVNNLNHDGYSQQILKNISTSAQVSDSCTDYIVHADDISYPVSTIQASYVIIVKSSSPTGDINSTDELIAAIDIRNNNLSATSNNGVFTIKLNKSSGGFLKIK